MKNPPESWRITSHHTTFTLQHKMFPPVFVDSTEFQQIEKVLYLGLTFYHMLWSYNQVIQNIRNDMRSTYYEDYKMNKLQIETSKFTILETFKTKT